MAEKLSHATPDFTPVDNSSEAKAAIKKIESLRKQEADLVEKLGEVRKEINVQSGLARLAPEPGFSNGVKEEAKEAPKVPAK